MELNSKKLERTSTLIHYAISIILCLFLILLSNKIIDDLNTATTRPEIEYFEQNAQLIALEKQLHEVHIDIEGLNTKKNTIKKTIATAKENYANEKQSFDNWVQTRKTLGSPDKDQEVIDREAGRILQNRTRLALAAWRQATGSRCKGQAATADPGID